MTAMTLAPHQAAAELGLLVVGALRGCPADPQQRNDAPQCGVLVEEGGQLKQHPLPIGMQAWARGKPLHVVQALNGVLESPQPTYGDQAQTRHWRQLTPRQACGVYVQTCSGPYPPTAHRERTWTLSAVDGQGRRYWAIVSQSQPQPVVLYDGQHPFLPELPPSPLFEELARLLRLLSAPGADT